MAATVGDAAIDLLALTGVLNAARAAGVSPGACLPPDTVSRGKKLYKAASGSFQAKLEINRAEDQREERTRL